MGWFDGNTQPTQPVDPDKAAEDAANEVARAVARFGQITQPLIEAANGFRLARVNEGWSEAMAEQLAATQYQTMLMKIIVNSME